MMGWNNDGSWGASQWLAMSFMMIIFWGLVIALVVWFVRSRGTGRFSEKNPTGAQLQGADDLLAQRFARGEIDEQEFTQRRKALHTSGDRS